MSRPSAGGSRDVTDATSRHRWRGREGWQVEELVAVVVAAVVLIVWAFPRLGAHGLWLDEAYSRAAVDHLGESLTSTRGTMGLYYVVLVAWGSVSTSTAWLRALSLLCTVATLPVLVAIGRRVGGTRVAVVAILLFVASPMVRFKAIEARSYAMEGLLVAVAWLLLLRALDATARQGRVAARAHWWSFTVLCTVAPLFHGYFFTQFAGMAAICLVDPRPMRRIRPLIPATIGCAVTSVGLALLAGDGVAGAVAPGGLRTALGGLSNWYLSSWWLLAIVLAGLLVVGALGLVRSARSASGTVDRMVFAAPLAWVLVPMAAVFLFRAGSGIYDPRYLSPSAIGVAIVMAVGIVAVVEAVSARFASPRQIEGAAPSSKTAGRVAAAAVAGIVLVISSWSPSPGTVEDWNAAATLVAHAARPGDGIIFVTEYGQIQILDRAPFEAAWSTTHRPIALTAISPARPLGSVHRHDLPVPLAEIRRKVAAFDRVWVVDYFHQDPVVGLTGHAPFTTDFDLVVDRRFRGGIVVRRYDRRGR